MKWTTFLVLVLAVIPAWAQQPTPEQAEAFRSLPQAEQQRLLRQQGLTPPGNSQTRVSPVPQDVVPGTSTQATPPPDSVRPFDPEIRIAPDDTLIIDVSGEAPAALRGRRTVSVDSEGRIRLPVLDRVMMAGLNSEQAADRLGAERALRDATVRVQILPVRRTGLSSLSPFGYELFREPPTTFAPTAAVPVPHDYMLGPGDTLNVQLFGKDSGVFSLEVTREGQVLFPQLGPITVAGLSFGETQELLVRRVEEQMIGTRASVTMGPLRTIRIFVLGEAAQPGAYTVSALTTATHALFVSGGVRQVGSLRNIEIKRRGETVARLDLYDLLLSGDTRGDVRLQADDVVFIPPAGPQVAIDGPVRRPAIYELRNERTAAEILTLAGGAQSEAHLQIVRLERISAPTGERELVVINLTEEAGRNTRVRAGDYLSIASVLDRIDGTVRVAGHVQRPMVREWTRGLRVSDLISDLSMLLPAADLGYALIRRESGPTRTISLIEVQLGQVLAAPRGAADLMVQPNDELLVFGLEEVDERRARIDQVLQSIRLQASHDNPPAIVSVAGPVRAGGAYPLQPGMRLSDLVKRAAGDLVALSMPDMGYALLRRETGPTRRITVESVPLGAALANPGSAADLTLQPMDQLILFSIAEVDDRRDRIEGVLNTLRLQASSEQPLNIVTVNGRVRASGTYPMETSMRASDLLRAGGGLAESAYMLEAEITRAEIIAGDEQQMTHLTLDLEAILNGDSTADIVLHPRDVINIKPKPYWADVATVEVRGEVRFPGTYSLRRNELLSAVIERAGGLTPDAFVEGSVFRRRNLREREQRELTRLADRLELELATQRADDDTTKAQQLEEARMLARQLRQTEAAGRLVIDLGAAIVQAGDPRSDIRLEDGDVLIIPSRSQEVTVVGEVHYPTSHFWEGRGGVRNYISRSGGLTKRADNSGIYVVRANGAVVTGRMARRIEPGDTIVVPLNPDQMSRLQLWTSLSQVFYQLGVAAAAAKSVGVF